MTIGSLMSRMGTAEKLSVAQIQQAIKDGTLPAYVGIPMLQEKMKAQQAMQSQQGAQQQPSIAEQVMAQAQAEEHRGIPQLESNLPAQGMAAGGIVALAGGGSYDDDTSDDDLYDSYDLEEANRAMDDSGLAGAIMARSNPKKPAYSSVMPAVMVPAAQSGAPASMAAAPAAGAPASPSMLAAIPAGIAALKTRMTEMFQTKEPEKAPAKESAKSKHKYHDAIVSEAKKLDLSPEFALKIAHNETGNLSNPETAVSPAGALGVMQLMPKTARGLGVKDPLNPSENISGGLRYAKQMLDKYGDEKLAAMAYNWGPGNVDKWLKSGKGIDSLPNETRKYATAFAEGGQVARLAPGGLGADAMGPFQTEAEQLLAEARAKSAARAAARGLPVATPAPAAAASQGITGLSPAANQARPSLGGALTRAVGSASGPLAASTAAGAIPTWMAGNYLSKLPDESLGALSNDIGSDTGFAAAIMNQARENERNPVVERGRSTAKADARLPIKPAVPSTAGAGRGTQGGPTAEELRRAAFEQEIGNTQDTEDMEAGIAAAAQPPKEVTKEAPKAERSAMDEYLQMLKGGYEDVKKQKEEDKYLALLAAGLGMMGGTSPFAAANIGQGGLHGVASLAAANKERGAEKAMIDKAYGQALYRQSLGESNAAQRAAMLQEQIRHHDITAETAAAQLAETARGNTLREKEYNQNLFLNAVKIADIEASKNMELQFGSPAEKEAYVYSTPLVRNAAKAAGIDLSYLTTPANKTPLNEKQKSLLDRWLK